MDLQRLPLTLQFNIFKGLKYNEIINMRLVSRDMRDIVDYYFTTKEGKKLYTAAVKRSLVFADLTNKINRNKNVSSLIKEKVILLCQSITVETFINILEYLHSIDISSISIATGNFCTISLESTTGTHANKNVEIVIKAFKGQITKNISYYNGNQLINVVNMINEDVV